MPNLSPEKFLGRTVTAGYRPSVMMTSRRPDDYGWFTWYDVEMMRRDPRCRFGLRILWAPLPTVTWEVVGPASEVNQWVDRTLRRIWERELPKMRRLVEYGSCGGEVTWRLDQDTDLVEFDAFHDVHIFDMRPVVDGGCIVGLNLRNGAAVNGGGFGEQARRVGAPRFLWIANEVEFGYVYGRGRLEGAWSPWKEKTARHGAQDCRKLWYVKNAYRGGQMRHPMGVIDMGDGTFRSCQDYAREIGEKSETGGILTLPNTTDEQGNYLWTYDDPKINGDLGDVREYAKDLDVEILEGMEIPPEVAQAAKTGSGWSGRSVPFLVYLASEDQFADTIIRAVDDHILKPGVAVNFGRAKYQIKIKSLIPPPEQQQGGQGGQGGQGQGEQQGGGEGGQGGGRQPGGLPVPAQLSLDSVRLGEDWTRYEGPHGGKGWKNASTGEVVYQAEKPGGGGGDKPSAPGKGGARVQTLKALARAGGDRAAAAKALAGRVGAAAWDRLPPKAQSALSAAWRIGRAIEHKAMIGFAKGKELAIEAAKERGLSPERAEMVGRVVAIADQAATWSFATFGITVAATGSITAGKIASYLPMASLAYLSYSTVRNPFATVRAARKVLAHAGAVAAHLSLDAAAVRDLAGELAGRVAAAGTAGEWYLALVSAALDDARDLAEAMRRADAALERQPRGPQGEVSADDARGLLAPPAGGEADRLALDAVRLGDDWARYQGPNGGRGWRNSHTGEVVYQEAKPGGSGESGDKKSGGKDKVREELAALWRELPQAGREAIQAIGSSLMRSEGLSDDQRVSYFRAAHSAISRMSPQALERFRAHQHLPPTFYPDLDGLRKGLVANYQGSPAAQAELAKPGLTIGGCYSVRNGRAGLHLDGDMPPNPDRPKNDMATAADLYAHEFAHAIDGPKHELSDSPEWQEAFRAELAAGKLTRYGASKASEGWAEFGRIMLNPKFQPEKIKQGFPRCYAVWEKHGLVPPTAESAARLSLDDAPGRGVHLAEIFTGRIDLPEGAHADLVAGGGQGDRLSLDTPAESDRSATENASGLVDEIIGRGATAGVVIADEIRRKVRALVKKSIPAGANSSGPADHRQA